MKASEDLSLAAGVPAPRDSKGREIPLDTKVMYDSLGNEYRVLAWFYLPSAGEWSMTTTHSKTSYVPEALSLSRPDSWERLEEDARKAPREYIEGRGITAGRDGRVAAMVGDIVRRAKALAGVSDRD